MVWVSTVVTLIGMTMALKGREMDTVTTFRLEEEEGPTAIVGLGILFMFVGSALGVISMALSFA